MDEYIGYYVRNEDTYVRVYKRSNEEYHVVCALPKGGIEELEREERGNNLMIDSNINLIEKNGEFFANSKEVAKNFNKNHKNVLRAIEEQIKMCSKLSQSNFFTKDTYLDSYGREQKVYSMNRDGFSLLVMGFTGKEATEWKIKYIEAFNKMEERIKKNNYQLPTNPMDILRLTFQVQEQQNTRLDTLDNDVKYLKDEVVISSSEYACMGNAVSQRVNSIQETYSLTPATKMCLRELYKAINHDIKRLTGAYTRSQIKRKDFAKVMEFIRIWTPDNVVNYRLKEMLNGN